MEARLKALIDAFVASDDKHILLSVIHANKDEGLSLPYMCEHKDGKTFVTLFSNIDTATKYIKRHGYGNISGNDPIGKLPKEQKPLIRRLFAMMNNGVTHVALIGNDGNGYLYDILRFILFISTDIDSSYNDLVLRPLSVNGFRAKRRVVQKEEKVAQAT